jgi:hypothetical protein
MGWATTAQVAFLISVAGFWAMLIVMVRKAP